VPREDSIELIPGADRRNRGAHSRLARSQVTPDTILMDLTDPQLEQELLNAQLALSRG
jgi:HlyD family secretion protein